MSDPKMNPLISCLIKVGNYLSYLLSEPKTDDKEHSKTIVSEIKSAAKEAFESLKNHNQNQIQLPLSFPSEKVIPKVFKKIQATLETIETSDPENFARELKDLSNEIDAYYQSEFEQKSSKFIDEDDKSHESAEVYPSFFPWDNDDHRKIDDYEKAFDSLERNQKNCLLFCLALLQKDSEEDEPPKLVIIRKRELIHWWIGILLINGPEEDELVLQKLVDEEFLIPTSNIPRHYSSSCRSKGYIIRSGTLSEKKLEAIESAIIYSTLQKGDASAPVKAMYITGSAGPSAIINTDIYTLNESTLDTFIRKHSSYRSLHLGRWSYDYIKNDKSTENGKSTKYVVVEDIEALKSFFTRLKYFMRPILLSLQGIGGIVELPDSVYEIDGLQVLDLKACPNLEILPRGIDSLRHLTHLDVSECYLLDHIPKGLGELEKLGVLKGLIINHKTSDEECGFNDLSKLNLIKLSVRATTTEFPTTKNLKTISNMTQLRKLKIFWVQSISSYKGLSGQQNDSPEKNNNDSSQQNEGRKDSHDPVLPLPDSLEKLELQAAPEKNASRMLDLITYRSGNCLKRLYITGGRLWKLDPYTYCFPNIEILRLRYLHQLHRDWPDCQLLFPNLSHLEVFDCPKLMYFPCGENGLWNNPEQF